MRIARAWQFVPAIAIVFVVAAAAAVIAQGQGRGGRAGGPPSNAVTVLRPARVFDGNVMRTGWVVVLRGSRIESAGPATTATIPTDAQTIDLPDATVLPGLIEAHSHVLLHPYNETSWNDQVAHELLAVRISRATNHLRATLDAGFTTIRDLGTEGAGYADVGLKQAVNQGIIPGPRMIVTTRAIVATGTYAPKGYPAEWAVPQGAEEADGDSLVRVVRDQISRGADWIKVYGDYSAGPNGQVVATFSQQEMQLIVDTARSLGRPVAVHATTPEGMRRATLAGAETIEHGDAGTPEVFRLMAQHGVALCPTLAAGDATSQYAGWKKGTDPEPAGIQRKRESFKAALAAGVTIAAGSDVGVFTHGDEARELEMMVTYGMPALDVLKAATSVNARVLHMETQIGRIAPNLVADVIAVTGDPTADISSLRKITLVIKNGVVIKKP